MSAEGVGVEPTERSLAHQRSRLALGTDASRPFHGAGRGTRTPYARRRRVYSALDVQSSTTGMAESLGFEPREPLGPAVFETAAINHSANLPFGHTTLRSVDRNSKAMTGLKATWANHARAGRQDQQNPTSPPHTTEPGAPSRCSPPATSGETRSNRPPESSSQDGPSSPPSRRPRAAASRSPSRPTT